MRLKSIHFLLMPLFLCAGSFLFLEYNYRYFYRFMEQLMLFQDTADYFRQRLGEPGGLLEYVAEYLTLFWNRSGGASLSFSFLFLLSWAGFVAYLKRLSTAIPAAWSLGPIALFWLYPQESLAPLLAVTVAVWSAWLYTSFTSRAFRIGVGLWLLWLTYFLAAPAYLLFALLVAVEEGCQGQGGKRWLWVFLPVGLASLLPLVAMRTLYVLPMREAYWSKHMAHPEYPLPASLYLIGLSYPLLACVAFSLRRWQGPLRSWIGYAVAYVGWIALMGTGLFFLKDPMEQAYRYDDWARQKKWQRIVNHARMQGVKDVHSLVYLNLALSHTGQLAEGLLYFPQVGEKGFIPHDPKTRLELIQASEVAWHMGQTNAAQRFAFVGVLSAQRCVQPRLMKRLVETYLVNGEPRAAAKFIKILSHNPNYRDWAEAQRPLLDETVCAETDWVAAKRKQLPLTDHPFDLTLAFPSAVAFLIDDHPDNQVAFDYGMAYLLLYKDLGAFLHYMDLVNERGDTLPKLYQEALCFVYGVVQKDLQALQRYPISPEVHSRFLHYLQEASGLSAVALRQRYGDTYYYYAQYAPTLKQD
ncbi:MAG: DUF6057 family protein [Parabacteroides sp.]